MPSGETGSERVVVGMALSLSAREKECGPRARLFQDPAPLRAKRRRSHAARRGRDLHARLWLSDLIEVEDIVFG